MKRQPSSRTVLKVRFGAQTHIDFEYRRHRPVIAHGYFRVHCITQLPDVCNGRGHVQDAICPSRLAPCAPSARVALRVATGLTLYRSQERPPAPWN